MPLVEAGSLLPSMGMGVRRQHGYIHGVSERLIQATKKDGYSLEFVSLYGAGSASPSSPPGSAYGCQTIIMSDVARGADFQRYSIVHNKHHSKTSRRLRDFPGHTEWRRIRVNEGELRRHAKAKASDALLAIRTICPKEAWRMLEDGMYRDWFPSTVMTRH